MKTVADYVADLRHLSEHCNYGASLENMLRDRIVCGINDESIQRKLLSESNLTFQTAFDTAQGMETAQKHVSDLRNDSETDKKEPSVLYTAKKDWALYNNQPRFKSHRNEGDCYRCGGSYSAESCPHKNTRCHHCSKVGHLIRCCNKSDSKPVHNKSSNRQFGPHKSRQTTHHMTATGSDSDTSETYSMFKVGKDRDQMKPYQVDLSVNDEKLSMEIDTGASVSVISESAYKAMEKPPQLKKSNKQLYTYTGNQLEICGAIDVSVEYHGKINILPLVVVAGDGPNLLGRNWLSVIQLDWSQIFKVCQQNDKPLVQVLDKYSDVFRDELGTMSGVEAHINVPDNATPKYYKPRPLAYALQEPVAKELERLQEVGSIVPVTYSEWAAPIVPIVKDDKSIRICGDYKVTVNQVSKLDNYPIPKTEELLAKIGGGQKFTILDLSHAYQQLLLDEESRKYTTINTHKGLFMYTRLPYGISSSPGIFQRTMENLLAGIPYVIVRLDDILVSGENDEKHMQNLEEVLKRIYTAGLRLKKSKCVFMAGKVEYCGHKVTAEGISPMEANVQAIKQAPRPENTTQLKSYLGMLNYYNKFLPDLSTVLAPLHKLLSKNVPWEWSHDQEGAFNKSKEMLTSTAILTHYDSCKEIVLTCDASPYGIGAVISHVMENGDEKPIAYTSRTLSTAEKNYAQIDKEGLAVVYGVKKFHQMLYGR